MALLKVIQSTVFKKLPKQSTDLPDDEKVSVNAGESFDLISAQLERGHYLVKLSNDISPIGAIGYFFAGHVQVEGLSVDVPSKIVRTRKDGKKWFAQVDSGSEFFVGRGVSYAGNLGLMNVMDDAAGQYNPGDHRSTYGFWADFIFPTAQCESNGRFNCLNTYDRAFFTFGFLQYAAHVPNGDFVKFFCKLLETPLGKGYFSDLVVQDGNIVRETTRGQLVLTNNVTTEPLLKYLNPTLNDVEEQEVIQAAKFVHWVINSQEHRDIQVECGIAHFKKAMQKYAIWYPLDGVPDKVCLVIADIHHQGRAKVSAVKVALDTNGDYKTAYQNLLEIGQISYSERIKTLKKAIADLEKAGILGTKVYSKIQKDFIPD